jgi:lipopolysaccharide export system protein LptA
MKKILAVAALSLATLGVAWAERADSLKPVQVDYDTADVDQVTQTYNLTGNVVVTRGTLVLKSDRALLKETPEGYMTVVLTAAPGKLATFRQKRDGGPDLWVEGQAQRIEYDERNELVKLYSNALIRELEGGRLTNEVNGEFISFDNRKEVIAVRNDASGENKPGKARGKLILAPRRPGTATAAPPAPGKQ